MRASLRSSPGSKPFREFQQLMNRWKDEWTLEFKNKILERRCKHQKIGVFQKQWKRMF